MLPSIVVIVILLLVGGGGWFVTTNVSATTIASRRRIANFFTSNNSLLVGKKLRDGNNGINGNPTIFVTNKRSTTGSVSNVAATSTNPSFMNVFITTILNSRRHLMAAAVARSTSIFIMYPADVIKTRLQMSQSNALRLSGLFNGVLGSLLGQVPYGVLTFGSYEMYKSYFMDHLPNSIPPIFKYATAAVFGDLTGSGWLCPSEVIKQKVQGGIYPSTMSAVSSIWKDKGVIGFYEGYFGGVARDVPFRVAQLTTYELTKNLYIRIKQQRTRKTTTATTRRTKTSKQQQQLSTITDESTLSPGEAAFCGAIAGSFSAAVTAPLDRIKTLLMTNSAAYGGTVLSCATKIWTEEGLRGLTTGVIPRVMYIAPSVAIFFVAYEMTQQRLQHWQVTSASKSQ